MSPKHLHRYAMETAFRWNERAGDVLEFSRIVECSNLQAETTHQLHVVNRPRLWASHPVRHRPGRPAEPRLPAQAGILRPLDQPAGRVPTEAWTQDPEPALRPESAPTPGLSANRDRTGTESAGGSSATGTDRRRAALVWESTTEPSHEPARHERGSQNHRAEAH